MSVQVTRLGKTFFAEVRGVDLSRPLSDGEFSDIRRALLDHGVLAFPGQHLTDDRQVAFSACFGPLEDDLMDPTQHLAFMSNLDENGAFRDPESRLSQFLRANQQWHSDSTFLQGPAKISLLSGRRVPPEGGETEWADMGAAWRALPDSRKRELDGLIVVHDFQRSRRKARHEFSAEERSRWPPLMHPLVRRHEDTGDKALYVGSQAETVVGMAEDEGRALIAELIEFSVRPEFVHGHRWSEGDIVAWDNRRVNHRGRPWPETEFARVMHRTTVKATGPTMDGDRAIDEYDRRVADGV